MGLVLFGVNHRSAPVAVRERMAYAPEEAMDTLRRLKNGGEAPQAFLLSTCNRTELYALMPEDERTEQKILRRLFLDRAPELDGDGSVVLYRKRGEEAVQHLFRVVCGLDSLVLGEQEILGQVKTAYDIACEADCTGSVLHRLAERAFHIGKRARSETAIGLGAVSVAFAAVELAEKVFQKLEGRAVLLVGAGENGALCARHLLSRKVSPLLIANRTLSRAEELAENLGGEVVSFDRLRRAMTRVDIVVSTTGSPEPVITRDLVKSVMKDRGHRALVLVDIAVPRDVDPGVDDIQNVFRFDMDALSSIVDRNLDRRRKEVPLVERLIQAEVDNFMRWWETLAAGPVIRDLNRAFDAVRKTEVERNARRFAPEDREQLEIFSRNLVRKLLMGVTTRIKRFRAEDPEEMEKLAVLREVFRLDEDEEDSGDDERR